MGSDRGGACAVGAGTRGEHLVEHITPRCHALAWRLWHVQGELLTGVRQPEVPADNHLAQRAIRPLQNPLPQA